MHLIWRHCGGSNGEMRIKLMEEENNCVSLAGKKFGGTTNFFFFSTF